MAGDGKTVQVLDPSTGKVEQLAPDAAQAEFRAGRRQLLSDDSVPMVGGDGVTIADFPTNKAAEALQQGWNFAASQDIARQEAQDSPLRAAAEGGLRGLTFGASDLVMKGMGVDPEGVRARAETKAGEAGDYAAQTLALIGTAGLSAPAQAAGGAARAASTTLLRGALLPTLMADKAALAITEAGAKALGEAGASEAAARIAGTALGQGTVGAGIGALGGLTEASLGDPNANAQQLLASAGMGALLGATGGAVLGGTISGIGEGLSARAGRKAQVALLNEQQLADTLTAQGLDVKPDNSIVGKFVKMYREDAPGALGYDVDDIRRVNSKRGQEWIRDREKVLDQSARDFGSVVSDMALEHDQVSKYTGKLRPEVTKDLISPVSGGAATKLAGDTFTTVRQEFQDLFDQQVALGLGEGGAAKQAKKHLQALDQAEESIFQRAGVPRHYEEKLVTTSEPTDLGAGFLRKGKAAAAPDAPTSGAVFGKDTQHELPLGETGNGSNGQMYEAELEDDVLGKHGLASQRGANQASYKRVRELDDRMSGERKALYADRDDKQAVNSWIGDSSSDIKLADQGFTSSMIPAHARESARRINSIITEKGSVVDGPLFRGISLTDEEAPAFLAKLRETGRVTDPSLASWSYDPAVGNAFGGGDANRNGDLGNIVFRVVGGKGVPIGGVEKELVVQKSGYLVKDIAQDSTGRYQVLLERDPTPVVSGPKAPRDQLTFDSLDGRPVGTTKMTKVPFDPAAPPVNDGLGSLGGTRTVTQPKQWSLSEIGDQFVLPAHTAGQTFDTLDTLRRTMGRAPKGASPEVKEAFARVEQHLAAALEDKATWGKAADFQRQMTAATRAKDEALADLGKYIKFTSDGQVDGASARRYMDGLANVKGDGAKAAVERWVSAHRNYADLAETHYRGQGIRDRSNKLFAQFAKVENDMRDKVSVMNSLHRLQSKEKSMRFGNNNSLNFAANGAVLGLSSAIGAPAALGVLAAGDTIASILRPGSAAVSRAGTIPVMRKVGEGLQALAAHAMSKTTAAFQPEARLARSVTAATASMLQASSAGKRREAYETRVKELQDLSDPQTFADNAQRAFGDTATAMPNHTAAMTQTAQLALQIILAQRPAPQVGTGSTLRGPAAKPSDAAILRFAQSDRAAQDPMGTLEAAAKRGVLLPNERAVLEQVSPQLLDTFRQALIEHADHGDTSVRSARFLESVMGTPDFARINAAQAVHAQAGAADTNKPQGGAGGPARPGKTSLSINLTSEADKLGDR